MPLNLEKAALEQEKLKAKQTKTGDLIDGKNKAKSLATAAKDAINRQVVAFDKKLTEFEKETAKAMSDRLKETPWRIYFYLQQELQEKDNDPLCFEDLVDFEAVEFDNSFLISPSSAAGCLPVS